MMRPESILILLVVSCSCTSAAAWSILLSLFFFLHLFTLIWAALARPIDGARTHAATRTKREGIYSMCNVMRYGVTTLGISKQGVSICYSTYKQCQCHGSFARFATARNASRGCASRTCARREQRQNKSRAKERYTEEARQGESRVTETQQQADRQQQ